MGILLPRETCWDIPEEEIKLEEIELAEFQDKDEGRIQQGYDKDDEIQAIKRNLENNFKEMKGVALGLCEWKDEHLWYQGKIWIPNDEELRTDLIHRNHDNPLAGDGGTAKTTELVSRQYYSPGMRETIKRYVKNCDICQRSKVVRHAPYGMLQPNEVPDQPWKSIAMDFITDLPISDGYDTVLVVIDRLTKMSHFIPCNKNLDARQFAILFFKEIIRLHGIPRDVITDRGSLFTSLTESTIIATIHCPDVGDCLFGITLVTIFLPCFLYLPHCYSSLLGSTFLCSLIYFLRSLYPIGILYASYYVLLD